MRRVTSGQGEKEDGRTTLNYNVRPVGVSVTVSYVSTD